MKKITRRKFLSDSLVMGSAIITGPSAFSPYSFGRDIKKISVHPNIDNLRVVGITDNKMTRDLDPGASWDRQNELVVNKDVWENIDRLACGLAKSEDISEAWRTIFIKPAKKTWADTVIAIKTNNIALQHTRSTVMAKICTTLTKVLGVKAQNINIYDACHGKHMHRQTPFSGLPEGSKIRNDWGGSVNSTSVPGPWKEGNGKTGCIKHLVDGSVDILINIAMCKGHSSKFGGFTMTMKNHFGTFSPKPGHKSGSLEYLISINKTPEILGEMDKKTGKVIFPRQQLCFIDALWASEGGPGGKPTHQPNFLAMGVLSPVVDYQIATKFRWKKMGWKPIMKVADRMLSEFGYVEADLPEKGKIIEVKS